MRNAAGSTETQNWVKPSSSMWLMPSTVLSAANSSDPATPDKKTAVMTTLLG
jgi:hypothetical protein